MLPIPVGILPSAPVGTHLVPGSVTSNSAIIEWGPPDDGSAESYMVAWKPDHSTSSYYSTVSLKERVVMISGFTCKMWFWCSLMESRVSIQRVRNLPHLFQTLVFDTIFIHTHYMYILQDIKTTKTFAISNIVLFISA